MMYSEQDMLIDNYNYILNKNRTKYIVLFILGLLVNFALLTWDVLFLLYHNTNKINTGIGVMLLVIFTFNIFWIIRLFIIKTNNIVYIEQGWAIFLKYSSIILTTIVALICGLYVGNSISLLYGGILIIINLINIIIITILDS